jgi:hypothetical protein
MVLKTPSAKLTGGMVQDVQNLLCKLKALSSNPGLTEKERKGKQEKNGPVSCFFFLEPCPSPFWL